MAWQDIINTRLKNLRDWATLATSPKQRKEFERWVVEPAMQRFRKQRERERGYAEEEPTSVQTFEPLVAKGLRKFPKAEEKAEEVAGKITLPLDVGPAVEKYTGLDLPETSQEVYGKGPQPFLQKPTLPLGKLGLSLFKEPEDWQAVRGKLERQEPLTKDEHAIAERMATQTGMDIAGMTGIGRVTGEVTEPADEFTTDLLKSVQKEPDSVGRVKARINTEVTEEAQEKGVFNWLDGIRRRLEDEFHPLEKIGRLAKKEGAEIPKLRDPEYLVKRNLGSAGIAEGELLGFGDIIRPHADEMDDLQAYLTARRSVNLSDRGIETGIDPVDAQRTVNELDDKFGDTAEKVYLYQRSILYNYLVDTGVLSEDTFGKIVQKNSDYVPFQRVMDEIEPEYLAGKAGGAKPIKRIRGSEREIINPLESIIENTYKMVTVGEQNRLWRATANVGEMIPDAGFKKIPPKMVPVAEVEGEKIFRPAFWNPKPNTISFFDDGKRVFYEVPEEISKVANEFGSRGMNLITKIMGYPSKLVRTGAVGVNPEFGLFRNPIRDQFSALWNSESGYIPFIDALNGMSHFSGNDELYRMYMTSGAGSSYLTSLDREFKQETLDDLLNKQVIIRKGGAVSKIRDVVRATEMGTRLGEYEKALQKTGDPMEAMMRAREITVDFSRIGSDTKVANQLIPFINARLQGTIRSVKSGMKNPARAGALGVSLGSVPAALLYFHNRQYSDWYDIEDYEKRNNWIVMHGDEDNPKKFSVPKDFVIGKLFGNTTENFLGWLENTNPDALEEMRKNMVSFLSPVSGVGEMIPTALQGPVEHIANYSFFLDREIVPEYMKKRPPAGRYHSGTREIAKTIGKHINVAPTVIDNYLYTYLPGAFSQVTNLVDAAMGGKKFDEVEKLPFVRVFGISGTGKIDREIKNAYFDIRDRREAISGIQSSEQYSEQEKTDLIKQELEMIAKDIQTMNSYERARAGGVIEFGDGPVSSKEINNYITAEYIVKEVNKKDDQQAKNEQVQQLEEQGFLTENMKDSVRWVNEMDKKGLAKTDRHLFFYEPGRQRAQIIINRVEQFKKQESRDEYLNLLNEVGLLDSITRREIKKLNKNRQ